jgi:hypothetical protein
MVASDRAYQGVFADAAFIHMRLDDHKSVPTFPATRMHEGCHLIDKNLGDTQSLISRNPSNPGIHPHVMMCPAHFRAPPCPRKGLRPPEMAVLYIPASMNSFRPEQADTGRNRKELM